MNESQNKSYEVGAWRVDINSGAMESEGNTVQLEARTMRLLSYLVSRAGEVISMDDLLTNVWPGLVVTPDSVYQSITTLRRALGDDPKQPSYIVTVPKFGYRLVATVNYVDDVDGAGPAVEKHGEASIASPGSETQQQPEPGRSFLIAASVLAVVIALVAAYWAGWLQLSPSTSNVASVANSLAAPAPGAMTSATPKAATANRTVAVLPLQDMTEQMNEEPFADGMTEELISRLSKVSGLTVASPLASLVYKEQPVDLKQVANALHVAYIVDGSVRKSGNKLRVTARLTRVNDGVVVWTETYDRSWRDKLMIQDDIANEVANALATSIH